MIANIIVDVNNKNVDQTFSYLIPKNLETFIKIGSRVKVSFGPRLISGIVISITNSTNYEGNLKEIIELVDLEPLLLPFQIELALKMKELFYTKTVENLNLMIPQALRLDYKKEYRINDLSKLSLEFKDYLKGKLTFIYNETYTKFNKEISENILNGNLTLNVNFKQRGKIKEEVYLKYNKDVKTRGKALELLNYLKEINKEIPLKLILENGYSTSSVNALVSKEAIIKIYKEVKRDLQNINIEVSKNELNQDQQKVVNSVDLNKYNTYLLNGVTASGKTLVYLKLIEKCLKLGKTSILLVPEISLTPQLYNILVNYFNNQVIMIHSGLSMGEKYDEWRKVKEKKAKVIVGARSAIFMPTEDLGIIIIDEEHTKAYIQENSPYYDVKEVAQTLAKMNDIPLLLASATPLVADYYKALNNEYKLLKLDKRATNLPLPKIEIVDLRKELKDGNKSIFSRYLQALINDRLNKHEQVLLFLNRRGFSTSVMCRNCGQIIKCPNCDLPLTYHKYNDSLKCHQCNYEMDNVKICPKCHSNKIRYVGLGTEKIEQEIKALFKDARLLRMDSDVMTKKNSYNEAYLKIVNHECDIIIGTEMVTKGFDFKELTLVGILNADMAFFYPSYDASEVAFTLLEQTSGRAGRFKEGLVVMQSYNPLNKALKASLNHDYVSFYEDEINKRKLMKNPPFYNIIKVSFKSLNKFKAYNKALELKTVLNGDYIVLGPTEDLYFKVNNYYNYNLFIKLKDTYNILELRKFYEEYNDKEVEMKIGRG